MISDRVIYHEVKSTTECGTHTLTSLISLKRVISDRVTYHEVKSTPESGTYILSSLIYVKESD